MRLQHTSLNRYHWPIYHSKRAHIYCQPLYQVRDGTTQLLEKSHIHEAELTLDSNIQGQAPLCAQLNADRTMATMLSLLIPKVTLDSQVRLVCCVLCVGVAACHIQLLPWRRFTPVLIKSRWCQCVICAGHQAAVQCGPRWLLPHAL